VTLELTPRSLERSALALARAADTRLEISFRLERAASTGIPSPGHWPFAHDVVHLDGAGPRRLGDLASELGVKLELPEGLDTRVSLLSHPRPLGQILDSVAKQTHCHWIVVIQFEPRHAMLDAAASEVDRMHEHLSRLGMLTPRDRRAELADELQRIERLPTHEREDALRGLAADIRSLGTLLQQVPGEHRGIVGGQVVPVARDYQVVLDRLPESKRGHFQPLLAALRGLDEMLRTLR
jgi:hypothetical protein